MAGLQGRQRAKVLILERDPTDAEAMVRLLRQADLVSAAKQVETKLAFVAELEVFSPEVILTDVELKDFDGMAAIEIVRQKYPDVPIIIVTGQLDDRAAKLAELIKAGARDYILKDRMNRLPIAVETALSDAAELATRRNRENELRVANERIWAIAASAYDAIIMIDEDGIVLFWNAAAERIFGFSRDDAMGCELHRLVVPASDLPYARDGLAKFKETGTGPIVGRVREVTARRSDGSEFRAELSISAVKVDTRWSAIAVVRDISDRPKLIRL